MPDTAPRRADATTAECRVFTRREGVLGALGHDLALRVERFVVEGDPAAARLEARFDAASLRVIAALRDGREDPAALSAADRASIEKSIVQDVLHAARFPEIVFRAERIEPAADGWRLHGTLALHGTTRPLEVPVRREEDRLIAEATLHQPDWGVVPYRAFLGALRVQPDVGVRVAIPAQVAGVG